MVLSPEEHRVLARWHRSTTLEAGLAHRGKIILLSAERHSHTQVAQAVGVQRIVLRRWAKRFLAQRADSLGRSLSPWDSHELVRQLITAGSVEDISAATVRQLLAAQGQAYILPI